ncbi:hypothetical protein NTGM5_120031 [Candidatus Nitrotoga sp. M5]|nr:hypothetical protein NTGM5_120031 [Candidatus Nitrotoga sp. M5]
MIHGGLQRYFGCLKGKHHKYSLRDIFIFAVNKLNYFLRSFSTSKSYFLKKEIFYENNNFVSNIIAVHVHCGRR